MDASPLPTPAPRRSSLSRMDLGVGVFFAVALSVIGWFLFSSMESGVLFNDVSQSDHLVRNEGTLTIAYDQPLTTYEPTGSGVVNRGYLVNTYETLVRFDRDFNVEPSLALSWGALDDDVWQFKLRPNVVFHDGSTFDADDVVASIERAQSDDSQIQSLVSNVARVEAVDPLTIQIETAAPDPTLLNKLTLLWIIPSETGKTVSSPVGTGPYRFLREQDGDWQFERFEDYWGESPSYPELWLQWMPDKFERYESFLSGDVDVLAQVPPVFVDPLLQMGYPISSLPSLEVNFLLFDTQDDRSPVRHRELREAIRLALNPERLVELTSGYAHPVSQFVSRGVFGYNSDLQVSTYDVEQARSIVSDLGTTLTVSLDLPEGLESLGAYVENQLASIGLTPTVTYWAAETYADRIRSGESDFFFLAWRSETGDAGDFFTTLVHSPTDEYGSMNASRYRNEAVDDWIETMDRNPLESVRLDQLKDLMAQVVNEDVIGVPLFESDTLVAIQKELSEWEPRMDNLILASDFE